MGDAISFGPDFMHGSLLYLYIIVFLPAFYITYIINTKKNINLVTSLINAVLIGVLAAGVEFIILGSFVVLPQKNILYHVSDYLLNTNPFLVIIEVTAIIIHYFFFRKRSKTNSTAKKKA